MRFIDLLLILGRIPAEAWDAIHPHRIDFTAIGAGRAEAVALNPQPLPPAPAARTAVAAANAAHHVALLAIDLELRGESGSGMVADFIDDWCGTPWPHKWPFPWPGPDPRWGDEVSAVDVAVGRAVAAVVFADLGSRLASDLGATFTRGADKLAEAAVAES